MPDSGVQPPPESSSSLQSPLPFIGRGPLGGRQETVVSTPRPAEAREDSGIAVAAVPSPMVERLFPGSSAPVIADEVAGIRVEHFVIERRIGSGGMGTVFLAHDERLQRPVALKVLAPQQTADPGSVQRFQNEARSAARLDHDHIARVFFYGEDQGLHYIAYEFVQGTTLRDLIRVRGRLEPGETVSYAVQLATALCHTSANGVVHRDIKPANIIITPQGKAKLVDLGLARKESLEESAQLTVAGTTLGTFDYISPEQAKDPRGVDVRSDIYSLGCTLYHALTGEPPFPEGTVLQRLLDHHDKPPADPALKNRRVPPALSAVIRKMMANDPKKRYPTAEDLLHDLLIIANAMGLRGLTSDTTLPVAVPGASGGSHVQAVGWSLTAAALVAAVVTLTVRPDLLRAVTRSSRSSTAERSPNKVLANVQGGTVAATSATSPEDAVRQDGQPPAVSGVPLNSGSSANQTAVSSLLDGQTAGPLVNRDGSRGFETVFGPDQVKLPDFVVPPSIGESPRTNTTTKGNVPPAIGGTSTDEPRPIRSAERSTTVEIPERTSPFVVAGKPFDSLDAACAEIRDQGTIELHFDGKLATPQHPLRLINKRVTIQAAKGRQPVLWFAPKDSVVDANQSRMMYVAGGALSLINVDLELQVPSNLSTADLWALVSCARPNELLLKEVMATIVNTGHHAAALIEMAVPAGDALSKMGMMKEGMPVITTQVRIDHCLLRGDCSAFRVRDAAPIRCDVEQTLFAVGEWLIQAELPSTAPPTAAKLQVQLEHTTCLVGNGLYSAQGGDDTSRRELGVEFFTRDNIIASASDQPLIDQQLTGDTMEYRKLVSWSGDRNFFDHLDQFWVVHTPGMGMQGMNFEAWCSFWGLAETAGSQNDAIVWRQNWRQRRWPEITAADAQLDRLIAVNPPRTAGTDGQDAGAALEQLPTDSRTKSRP